MGDKQTRPGIYISRDGTKITSVQVRGYVSGYSLEYLDKLAHDICGGIIPVSAAEIEHPDLNIVDNLAERVTKRK